MTEIIDNAIINQHGGIAKKKQKKAVKKKSTKKITKSKSTKKSVDKIEKLKIKNRQELSRMLKYQSESEDDDFNNDIQSVELIETDKTNYISKFISRAIPNAN